MKGVIIFIVCLLFLQVVFSLSSSFTTDLHVVELDGSVGQVTWNYDLQQQRERLVYHRQEAQDTLNIRLYDLGVEYLVLEGVCYALPLDKSMPSTSDRYSDLSYNKETIKWSNTVDGPVDASLFEIPSSCIKESKVSESICDACVALGDKVVSLGCNASSSVISHACGASAPICVVILDRLCSGVCEIQQCACDVCIKFTICDECVNGTNTTSTSSSTSTTHTHTTGPASSSSQFSSVASYIKGEDIYDQEGNQEDKLEGGVFCSTCLSVAQQVINLGCNATSSEIANLCGNLFSDVCKQVLETLCSGACDIEDCASQSCCLFDLCDGASCNSTLAVPPSHISTDNGVVKLQL